MVKHQYAELLSSVCSKGKHFMHEQNVKFKNLVNNIPTETLCFEIRVKNKQSSNIN